MVLLGYVRGIIETSLMACIGDRGVTLAQTADVVVKFLRDHPEGQHLEASNLARAALFDALMPLNVSLRRP
jgi:Rap1a immunity proteins